MSVYYKAEFTSDTGTARLWTIDGPTEGAPATTSVTPSGRGHTTVSWQIADEDEFATLMPSEMRVSFYDTASGAVLDSMVESLTEQDFQYTMRLYDAPDVLRWAGFVETGAIERSEDGNLSMILTATDGLKRLEDFYYTTDEDTLVLYSGRASVVSIIADVLDRLGLGLDIYTAANLYPRTASTQIAATVDPLSTIYIDRSVFRDPGEDELSYGKATPGKPIRCSDVLDAVLRRFGLKIAQWEGAWHVVQQDLLFNDTYSRWHYDSSGAVVAGKATYDHVVAAVDESVERGPGTVSALMPYSAVRMDYQHGKTGIILNPDLTPTPPPLNPAVLGVFPGWTLAGTYTGVYPSDGKESSGLVGCGVLRQPFSPDSTDPLWPSGQGDANGSWDYAITNFVNFGGTASYNTADTVNGAMLIPSGTVLYPTAGLMVMHNKEFGSNVSGETYTPTSTEIRYAIQVSLFDGDATTKYLDSDGAWVDEVTWLAGPARLGDNTIKPFGTSSPDATPFDGYVTLTLGPVFEYSAVRDGGDYVYAVPGVADGFGGVWDWAQIQPVVAGVYNPEVTSTVNYVARNKPRVKQVAQFLGDGPVSTSLSGLTSNDTGTLDGTSDWEEGAITGGASGDSIDAILTRIHLRTQRNPRRTHSASYHGLAALPGPQQVIDRDSENHAPLSEVVDYVTDTVGGRWYRCRQDGFTDDLETGVYSGGTSIGSFGGDGQSGFILEKLSSTYFTEASKRLTVTTATISAGSGAATIAVAEMAEPLLKNGDQIVIIHPSLSYDVVQISDDQMAGATTLSIEDPANPGNNYDFPVDISYPASIFFLEEELLTLARLGEQGFAVTVNATPLGLINGGGQSGTITSLNVKEWIASLEIGETVWINGSELTLTAAARRGDATIEFSSAAVTCADEDPIYAAGQSTRAEFLIAADKITAFVNRVGDQIATVTADTTSTTVNCTALPIALAKGDVVFLHTIGSLGDANITPKRPYVGRVQKRIVAADAAVSATSFTVTSAVTIWDGDVIVPSYMVGLRVDMDGVGIENTHLFNTGANAWNGVVNDSGEITTPGTQGWIITSAGDAEFNAVNARTRITAGSGNEVVIDQDGITLAAGTSTPTGNDDPTVLDVGGLAVYTYTTAGVPQSYIKTPSSLGSDLFIWAADKISLEADAGPVEIAGNYSGGASVLITSGADGPGTIIGGSNAVSFGTDAGTIWYTFPVEDGDANDVLTTDGAGTLSWAAGGGGATAINDLTDVVITGTPADNELLAYDTGTSKWINQTPTEAGLDARYIRLDANTTTSGGVATQWAGAGTQYTNVTGLNGILQYNGTYLAQFVATAIGTTATTFTISTSTNNGNIVLDPHGTGDITLSADAGDVNITSASGTVVITTSVGAMVWPVDAPNDADVLTWNTGGALSWEAIPAGVSAIDDLSDVAITSVGNGEILWYSSGWINGTLAEAGVEAAGAGASAVSSHEGTYNHANYDTAVGWGDHASAGYLTSETSHADVVVDGDFTSNGILKRTAAGTYGIVTDNSANWDTAYGWGDWAGHTHDVDVDLTGYGAIANTWIWGNPTTATGITVNGTTISIKNTIAGDEVVILKDDITINGASVLTAETSHADVLVDGDFGTAGLMATDGAGTYSIVTNNSANWDTAYGWGDWAGHTHDVDVDLTGYGAVSNTWIWGDPASGTGVTVSPAGVTVSNDITGDAVVVSKDDITVNTVSVSLVGHTHDTRYIRSDATSVIAAGISTTWGVSGTTSFVGFSSAGLSIFDDGPTNGAIFTYLGISGAGDYQLSSTGTLTLRGADDLILDATSGRVLYGGSEVSTVGHTHEPHSIIGPAPGNDAVLIWDDSVGEAVWRTLPTAQFTVSATTLSLATSGTGSAVTYQTSDGTTTITADTRVKVNINGADYYMLAEAAP